MESCREKINKAIKEFQNKLPRPFQTGQQDWKDSTLGGKVAKVILTPLFVVKNILLGAGLLALAATVVALVFGIFAVLGVFAVAELFVLIPAGAVHYIVERPIDYLANKNATPSEIAQTTQYGF